MVKYLITIGDIHIKYSSDRREKHKIDNYLNEFISYAKEFVLNHSSEEVRIVITGDLFDKKLSVENECKVQLQNFLKKLNEITKTYIICGNHDCNQSNTERICSLYPIFNNSNLSNCIYLDSELDFKSGVYIDENIVFCLYSIFDDFKSPDIKKYQEIYPNKNFIGLIHTDINSTETDTGFAIEDGFDYNNFEGLDCVIAGHIHKRAEYKQNGVKIVYCGSMFQQNMGENITGHGGYIYDVQNVMFEEFDIDLKKYILVSTKDKNGNIIKPYDVTEDNTLKVDILPSNKNNDFKFLLYNNEYYEWGDKYGYYKFVLKDISDIENDKMELINF